MDVFGSYTGSEDRTYKTKITVQGDPAGDPPTSDSFQWTNGSVDIDGYLIWSGSAPISEGTQHYLDEGLYISFGENYYTADGYINGGIVGDEWSFNANTAGTATVAVHMHTGETTGGELAAAGTTATSFSIGKDTDAAANDISLKFGDAVSEKIIKWDQVNARFDVGSHMNIAGTLTADSITGVAEASHTHAGADLPATVSYLSNAIESAEITNETIINEDIATDAAIAWTKISKIGAVASDVGAEPTLTKGDLTEATSSVLTIGSGTGAVIGSGTTIQVKEASGVQSGYLSSTDWTTFNNKVSVEADPLALLTAGTDNVKDTHIDWGVGVGQVSTTDMTEGTNLYYTDARVDTRLDTNQTIGGTWTFSNQVTVPQTPTNATDAASKSYVDTGIAGLSWKEAVLDYITDNTLVPPTEVSGDRYVLATDGGVPHANWDGAEAGDMVDFNGTSWVEEDPQDGDAVFVEDVDTGYVYTGTVWTPFTGASAYSWGDGLSNSATTVNVGAGTGIDVDANSVIHEDMSTQTSVDNSLGTVIQDVTMGDLGHVTGLTSVDLDGRYYTETEADTNYVNVSGDTTTGTLTLSPVSGYALVTTAGNVGIGTTAPGGLLQVGDATNKVVISSAGAMSFAGTGDIDLPNDSVDTTDVNFNYVTSVATSSPLSGGAVGSEGTAISLSIVDAAADGATKGAATFTAADFSATTGNISIDYANAQAASGAAKGFLTSADWTTFNNKQDALTFSTGLTNTGGTITTNDGQIVHDNLSGFEPNEHIDWTTASSNLATTGTGAFTPAAITIAGSDDKLISLTQTLNDTIAAAETQTYTGVKFVLTSTDVTGWDTVNLMDLHAGAAPASKFKVDDSGNLTMAGSATVSGGTIDLGVGDHDDLTATDITDLTDGEATTLHIHTGLAPGAHATTHHSSGSDEVYWSLLEKASDATTSISSEIDTDISTHADLTATHGATGAVVGTTNTQTLSNKTIDAVSNGLTVGTSELVVSSGNVGIGITNPSRVLHVTGQIKAADSGLATSDGKLLLGNDDHYIMWDDDYVAPDGDGVDVTGWFYADEGMSTKYLQIRGSSPAAISFGSGADAKRMQFDPATQEFSFTGGKMKQAFQNLVRGGSFESWDTPGWYSAWYGGAYTTDSQHKFGTKSLYISDTDLSYTAYKSYYVSNWDRLKGNPVTLSVWARTDTGTATAAIGFNTDSTKYEATAWENINVTTAWTNFTYIHTLPAGATTLKVYLYGASCGNGATPSVSTRTQDGGGGATAVYFDGATVVEGNLALEFGPSPVFDTGDQIIGGSLAIGADIDPYENYGTDYYNYPRLVFGEPDINFGDFYDAYSGGGYTYDTYGGGSGEISFRRMSGSSGTFTFNKPVAVDSGYYSGWNNPGLFLGNKYSTPVDNPDYAWYSTDAYIKGVLEVDGGIYGDIMSFYGGIGQSSNLLTYSQDFMNAVWVKSTNMQVTNGFSSPDGGTSACKMTDTRASGSGYESVIETVSVTGGEEYTFSSYAKQDTAGAYAYVGLKSNGSGDSWSYKYVDLYNDPTWRRFSVTKTMPSDATQVECKIDFYGSSSCRSIFIWGAQLRQASTPGIYIATTASPSGASTSLFHGDGSGLTNLAATSIGGTFSSISVGGDLTIDQNSVVTDDVYLAVQHNSTDMFTVDREGDVYVGGNLQVQGDQTILNVQTVEVESSAIKLNRNVTGSPTLSAKILVERGTSADTAIRWNETSDVWDLTADGTNFYGILNTNTSFAGDVSGAYDNLQLGANSIGANELASTAIQSGDIDAGDLPGAINANKIANATVSNTEFQYLGNVTSDIQSQLAGKQATITGAATTIDTENLSTSRALISNGSGKVAVSAVTSTEISYLDGVTSALQTQLDGMSGAGDTLTGLVQSTTTGTNYITGGKLGIGISAPTADLTVKGDLSAATTGTLTVTNGSASVTTSVDLTGHFSAGDAIKIVNSAPSESSIYTVNAINATTITLDSTYSGTTDSDGSVTAKKDPDLFLVKDGNDVAVMTLDNSGNLTVEGTINAAVEGTSSNANLLDNIDSSSFLRSDVGDSVTTGVTLNIDTGATLSIDGTLDIGGTAVTPSATEINILDGGLSAAELDGSLLTATEGDTAYVNVNGDTMTGDLTMTSADISIDAGQKLNVEGSTGDSYMKYNSTSGRLEIYVGGEVVAYMKN